MIRQREIKYSSTTIYPPYLLDTGADKGPHQQISMQMWYATLDFSIFLVQEHSVLCKNILTCADGSKDGTVYTAWHDIIQLFWSYLSRQQSSAAITVA